MSDKNLALKMFWLCIFFLLGFTLLGTYALLAGLQALTITSITFWIISLMYSIYFFRIFMSDASRK